MKMILAIAALTVSAGPFMAQSILVLPEPDGTYLLVPHKGLSATVLSLPAGQGWLVIPSRPAGRSTSALPPPGVPPTPVAPLSAATPCCPGQAAPRRRSWSIGLPAAGAAPAILPSHEDDPYHPSPRPRHTRPGAEHGRPAAAGCQRLCGRPAAAGLYDPGPADARRRMDGRPAGGSGSQHDRPAAPRRWLCRHGTIQSGSALLPRAANITISDNNNHAPRSMLKRRRRPRDFAHAPRLW
jgi:hypothetical protein